jgi:hypothetical protein
MNNEFYSVGSLSNDEIEEGRYSGQLQSRRKKFLEGRAVLLLGTLCCIDIQLKTKYWVYLEGIRFGIPGSLFGLYEHRRQILTNLIRERWLRLSVIS